MPKRLRTIAVAAVLVLLAIGAWYAKRRYGGPLPIDPGRSADAPNALATWPWSSAARDEPRAGVTHWKARDDDGTILDLLRFDFSTNPRLRLELYDQDEDDEEPFDNTVRLWDLGVGQATRRLNEAGRGPVIAAWNGLFFGYRTGADGERVAHHVAPLVLRGKVYHYVGNHRWTFGVRQDGGGPTFGVLHLPDRETLASQFDFAAGGAQCLVREGVPLALQPFPEPGEKPLPRPVPSTPEEAGYIPGVDHIRTSRTSMGWVQDSQQLYLLIVKEPDHEVGSSLALKGRLPVVGGWTVADLQRFWLAMDVWGAVNIDGGDVTQMTYLRGDGAYELVPPRWASREMRLTFSPEFRKAPKGGTLMYFHIREVAP